MQVGLDSGCVGGCDVVSRSHLDNNAAGVVEELGRGDGRGVAVPVGQSAYLYGVLLALVERSTEGEVERAVVGSGRHGRSGGYGLSIGLEHKLVGLSDDRFVELEGDVSVGDAGSGLDGSGSLVLGTEADETNLTTLECHGEGLSVGESGRADIHIAGDIGSGLSLAAGVLHHKARIEAGSIFGYTDTLVECEGVGLRRT